MAKGKFKLDGVSFSIAAIQGYKSENEFVNAPENKHLFEGPNQEAKLKEAWAKAQPEKPVSQNRDVKASKEK